MAATAQSEKDKGNAAFKSDDFPTAIGHYTAAFIADPSNPTYPLNRAAAYLKLGKNEDAERDCDAVLRLDGRNVKGLFRRGQARVSLQKLKEAESDFQQVIKLDPSNAAAKQELKKVQDALKSIPTTQKPRTPIDVSVPRQAPSGSVPPKRRRVPITIVEPEATTSVSSSSNGVPARTDNQPGFITPVSSRPLSRSGTQSSSSPSVPSTPAAASSSAPGTTSGPSSSSGPNKSTPKTFQEAKAARDGAKPRGGIFKADGHSKLFYPAEESQSAPEREAPQTLVAFMKIWETLETDEDRWDVLRQIPASRLPVLFKMSIDASILAAIVHTLRVALAAGTPEDAERQKVARAYMVNLPRVPRFNTVSMMMNEAERAEARAVWELLGRSRSEGLEGEMDRRKEDGSRAAWGCR